MVILPKGSPQKSNFFQLLTLSALESIAEGILVVDLKGRVVFYNQKFRKFFKMSSNHMATLNYDDILSFILRRVRDQGEGLLKWVDLSTITNKESHTMLQLKDGREFEAVFKAARSPKGIFGFVVCFQELNKIGKSHHSLSSQMIYDSLSGLYSRYYFNERFQQELHQSKKMAQPIAILRCDLDRFNTVNYGLGQDKGDEVLREISKKLRGSVTGGDLVFRWEGDEFAVVLFKAEREGALTVADRISAGVKEVGKMFQTDLTVSIGISLYPDHGEEAEDLVQMAEWALDISKQSGEKINIGEENYHLGEDSIKVVFQPIMDIFIDKGQDQVLGYEALGRDPQNKFSILEFFKKYQAVGQLNELKSLCFKSQLKIAQGLELHRVFINVDFNLLKQLGEVPKPPGIDVVLEISEMEAMNNIENHLKIVKHWRKKGYHFAIDDFGAGFISLPFISQACPEYIKLDRTTILQATQSSQFKKILRDLVRVLGSYASQGIIAEGIENHKELKVVKEIGIYLVQGFLLGKPKDMKN